MVDVAMAITSTLRSYDATVRWGGDEFVCSLSDVTLDIAADRVSEIQRGLQTSHSEATISTGLAELNNGDTYETLLARADSDLHHTKTNRNN